MPRRSLARGTAAALTALAVLAPAAATPAAPASQAGPASWQTPSGNIACLGGRDTLRCDIRKLGNRAPRRPAGCQGAYGHAFEIEANGSRGRRLCASDTVGGEGLPVVRYGRTWRRSGFTCTVRESGVRCTNQRGHGFALRIGRQRVF